MDQYPIEAAGSKIENNPMYRVVFKQPIDPINLEEAIRKAIIKFPLFGTKVKFDKEYYLQTNNKPIIIKNVNEENRPKTFGKNTNGYPWQICYENNKLTLEWLHGITDGCGALEFLEEVLKCYFHVEKTIKNKYLVGPGLEPFFDSKEKGLNHKTDPTGFPFSRFPYIKNRGYKTDCHELVCETKDILELATITNSSVAPIITILFSKALRNKLPANLKNKRVACNVVLDLRRPLNYETMHNCVEYKRMTYIDEYEDMSFTSIAQEYKHLLDNARLLPNVVKIITDRVKLFKAYHLFPSKRYLKSCAKLVATFAKNTDCNFVMTYPGKIKLPKRVADKIENIDFKVWHDFGECILACVDYKGQFNLNISENFVDKGVVDEFIKLSNEVGIHWQIKHVGEFEQAHFVEE